jgi:hypothetical protein
MNPRCTFLLSTKVPKISPLSVMPMLWLLVESGGSKFVRVPLS